MFDLQTEIVIQASAEAVWVVLSDFPRHAEWNPFVKSIEGTLRAGEKLSVQICPPGGKGMRFKPRVLVAAPGRELRWLGRFLLPGLFDGEHYFIIEACPEGGVRFIQGERFSGVLVLLAKSSLQTGVKAGFEAMNLALKARVEGLTSRGPL